MEKEKRQYSIDLLRILSMLGIIMIHVIKQGGIIDSVGVGSLNYYIIQFMYITVLTSVNIFAIISGYLYVKKEKASYKNIVSLLVAAIFYSIVITIIFYVFNLFNIRDKGILKFLSSIFPPIVGRYWYITCYVVVFCLIPYINIVLNHLKKEQLFKLLILLFLLFSAFSTFGLHDYFGISRGHSPSWLIYCYCIGAYLRKYKRDYNIKKYCLYLLLILLFLTIFVCIPFWVTNKLNPIFISYNSPFILICSILIFMIVSSIKMRNSNIICWLSKVSFGVYLIHAHLLIYDFILNNRFNFLSKYNCFVLLLGVVLISCSIYIICSIIEAIRLILFNKLKIDNCILKIGNCIDKYIDI